MESKKILLGETIRQARKFEHLTQMQLAQKCDLKLSFIQRIESSNRKPDVKELKIIANNLTSVRFEELLQVGGYLSKEVNVAAIFKNERLKRAMTKEEVAKKAQVSIATIGRSENSYVRTSMQTIETLADVYELDIVYLKQLFETQETMKLALLIKDAREKQQIESKELARLIGLSEEDTKGIESGDYKPGIRVLHKLAQELQIDIFELLKIAGHISCDEDLPIGQIIKEARILANLTLEEVAKPLGISVSLLYLVEIGERKLKFEQLEILYRVLKVQLEKLDVSWEMLMEKSDFLSKQKTLSNVIYCARKKANLTKKEFASHCNIDIRTLYSLEKGERIPNRITVKKIATFLNHDVDELVHLSIKRQEENDMKIGKIIKKARQERGLTKEKLAYKMDISVKTLSNIEANCDISIRMIHKFAKYLELDVLELLKMEGFINCDENSTICEIFKQARILANLTQIELAEICNVTSSEIHKIESGDNKILLKTMYAIYFPMEKYLKKLGFTLEELQAKIGYIPNQEKTLGNVVFEERSKLGMTAIDFAKKCEVSTQTLYRIEQKGDKPSCKTLNKISLALNYSYRELKELPIK